MADENSTGASAPAGATGSETRKVIANTPGNISLDSFLRRTEGKGIDDIKAEEADSEVDAGEEEAQNEARSSASAKEREVEETPSEDEIPAEEDSEEESEETEEEESEEEGEEDAEEEPQEEAQDKKKKGKAFKVIGKDGKEFSLPDDAIVEKQIDGKMQRIPLKEALNIAAGEITVNQRLSKVASFYEDVKKHSESIQAEQAKVKEREEKVFKYIEENRPDMALVYLAEQSGTSPVAMYRKLLANLATAVQNFEGRTPEQIENHFLNLESQWHKDKESERRKSEEAAKGYQAFTSKINEMRSSVGVSEEEFVEAVAELEQSKQLSKDNPEEAAKSVINHVLHNKHLGLIDGAIKKVNPKLANNQKLVRLVYENTDPIKFTEDDIAEIIREVSGEQAKVVASNLSKKAGVKTSSPEKKTEVKPKKYRSLSEMRESFGFTR
jgi:hypothetical protein